MLNNQPKDRFSFGLSSGYIASIGSTTDRPRANIQSGKTASNPFARSISLATVNLPLWGYDGSAFDMTMRERIRPFLGIPFSPNFGVAAGISVAFNRTLALNAGWARLWYDTPADGEQIEATPNNKGKPFELASTGAWFLSAGYVFK